MYILKDHKIILGVVGLIPETFFSAYVTWRNTQFMANVLGYPMV